MAGRKKAAILEDSGAGREIDLVPVSSPVSIGRDTKSQIQIVQGAARELSKPPAPNSLGETGWAARTVACELYAQGYRYAEIGAAVGVSGWQVRRWSERYRWTRPGPLLEVREKRKLKPIEDSVDAIKEQLRSGDIELAARLLPEVKEIVEDLRDWKLKAAQDATSRFDRLQQERDGFAPDDPETLADDVKLAKAIASLVDAATGHEKTATGTNPMAVYLNIEL